MTRENQLEFSLRSAGGARRVVGVAVKPLVTVDLPERGSHQHEFNGVQQLREILGLEKIKDGLIRWFVLRDAEEGFTSVESRYTWYDAREAHVSRTEWRLYYAPPHGLDEAREGDLVFLLALEEEGSIALHAYVVSLGSTWERQLRWLFGLDGSATDSWAVRDAADLATRARSISAYDLLDSLELEEVSAATPDTDLELVHRRFGLVFPTTAEFSEFARQVLGLDADTDADTLLVRWIEREEQLFRALEEYIVNRKLTEGFESVDDFIGFSLSVHNRRKSRMGWALENHIRAILDLRAMEYSYNQVTENRARPDFLFPSIAAYRDAAFPAENLRMLGAKSTCKDRWRQVLSEADRIPRKHLLTLEPGISEAQTDEMGAAFLQLVVPEGLHSTYLPAQSAWISTFEGFLKEVRGAVRP